ncbi:ATP-grasp domain-containing protein [Flavobacteriaceae bacterium]|nr:ATP-grasp domain-containing protein [Flavobacteriaceae bacterium]MDC3242904.1 ATP-grasp domain-containing protein [Flavobacteriaceae bacterium]MDC3326685.1 ATP-grasp domain-containing protein [Flavobacteriaceae bacterium]
MPLHILFTCAGRRNYLINYFRDALKGRGKVFAIDMSDTAPAMVDADVAITVPSVYDINYIPSLIEIIQIHKIDAIISLNDLELPILSRHLKYLQSTGVKVLVSSESVIDIAFDKIKTFNFIKSIGLKTPLTFTSLKEANDALKTNKITYPVVVKPRWGSASIGIDFPETYEELNLSFKLQHIKLKKSILNIVSQQDANNAILIQENMNGQEYGLDIVNDFEGNYFGTFVRKKINMRSGETDKAISVIDDRFNKIGEIISSNLRHIGILDCDIFVSNNEFYILELNPRFGGGYPFSHEAGINIAAIYIDWLFGEKDIKQHNKYKSGMLFSKCDKILKIKQT